jgi:Leucine Rich Repeat (LRR) protein
MELYFAYVIAAGAIIAVAGFVGLIIAAFRTHALWGFGTLLVVGAPFFVFLRWARARLPVWVMLGGVAIAAAPYAVNYVQQHFIDLGERDKIVDGERHLTLTGWDKTDYSVLLARPDAVVLQMANGDVTDATLDYLKPMTQLRELDLNDTKITDAGLASIQDKPLVILRVRNTAITDAGFREHLLRLNSLMELDLRGTAVEPATFREWKKLKSDRRGFAPTPRPTSGATP